MEDPHRIEGEAAFVESHNPSTLARCVGAAAGGRSKAITLYDIIALSLRRLLHGRFAVVL